MRLLHIHEMPPLIFIVLIYNIFLSYSIIASNSNPKMLSTSTAFIVKSKVSLYNGGGKKMNDHIFAIISRAQYIKILTLDKNIHTFFFTTHSETDLLDINTKIKCHRKVLLHTPTHAQLIKCASLILSRRRRCADTRRRWKGRRAAEAQN
jgi:hypothetical protein